MRTASRRKASLPGPADFTIRELLSYRLHKVTAAMSRSAALRYRRQFDVSLGEWRALALLGGGTARSINQLAREADFDKAQMSRVVAGLTLRGLVERRSAGMRGKTVELALTRVGQALYRRLMTAAKERDAAFNACLTPAMAAAVEVALARLAALARAMIGAESAKAAPRRRRQEISTSVDHDNA